MKKEKSELLTKIAFNLKRIREDKNLKIDELSEKSGINKGYLKKIEEDNAPRLSISKVIKIASALDVNLRELFT